MDDISKSDPFIKALIAAGADLYEVGGPVRDRFLGREVKDHDILCRKLPIERIIAAIRPFGKVATVGKSFGVIKFNPHRNQSQEIDIALPRRERSTGSGHRDFEVDSDPEISVEDDLGRRDFTVNAMALSMLDGRLIDPFGGRSDLEKKIVRMVFPRAFKEDPLRLLRAIQFAARFELEIEPITREAMIEDARLIETISGERITYELIKLMHAKKPSVGFKMMADLGILKYALPEIFQIVGVKQEKMPGDDVFLHTMRALDAARDDRAIESSGDLDLMFAVLLHDIGKAKTARFDKAQSRIVFFGHQLASVRLARKLADRIKLSAAGLNVPEILRLVEHHMFETKASFTDRAVRRFVAKIGKDLIFKLMDMRVADNRGGKHPNGIKGVERLRGRIMDEISRKAPFGPADLAINGHDIMALGAPEGRMIGQILKELVELVLDNPELNEREKLISFAADMIKNGIPVRSSDSKGGDDEEIGRKEEEEISEA